MAATAVTDATGQGERRATPTMWPTRLIVVVLLVALAFVAIKALDIARYDAAILRFPFQVDDAEGVVLAEARMIGQGHNPYAYQPSPSPSFVAGPYPPVYTLLNTMGMQLLGPTFKFGRAVQLLGTLAVGVWVAWAVARSGRGRGNAAWLVGAWVASLFLTAHLVAIWSVRVRPDMAALAANLAGVSLLRAWWDLPARTPWRAETWPRGADRWRLAAGAACFALGWWTKQTFIAVPLAFTLVLFLRRPKAGITLGAVYGALILVPFGALTLLTDGGFFQKTVTYQGSWEWAAFRRLAQPFAERYGLLLVAGLLGALLVTLRARRLTFAVAWFALACVTALGAGTSGGNHNHFVELLAAATLLLGSGVVACMGAMRDARGQWWLAGGIAAAVLLLTGVGVTEREERYSWLAREYRQPTAAERVGLESIAAYVANHPGPVYSTDVGLLVITGQSVRVTDPFTMATEVRLGRWDDRELVADVQAGRYALIVVNYEDVAALDPDQPPTDATPGLIRALQTRYHLAEKNVLRVYVPN